MIIKDKNAVKRICIVPVTKGAYIKFAQISMILLQEKEKELDKKDCQPNSLMLG